MDEQGFRHWYWIEKWREDPVKNLHYLDKLWGETKPHCLHYLLRRTTLWQRDCHLDMYWGNVHVVFMKMVVKYKTEYGDWLYLMNLGLRDAVVVTHREYYTHKSILTRGSNVGELLNEFPSEEDVQGKVIFREYIYQWINSLKYIDQEIAHLRLDGFTIREVADGLSIGIGTVHRHLKTMENSWETYKQGEQE